MLIARAPVRLGLAGGGTDLPAYYEQYGGSALSVTIDKYFYAFLNVNHHGDLQITSSDYRTFYRHEGEDELLWDGDLSHPRAILHHFGIKRGASLFLASEIPPGTGLGSSSTVAVAIIKAVMTASGLRPTRHEVAELACYIELEKLGMPIGKQDQYAAAFGGLNWFRFSSDGVVAEPLTISPDAFRDLEQRLMLFFTGASRHSGHILAAQQASSRRNDPAIIEALHAVKQISYEMKHALEEANIRRVGELLHKSWERKKRFASGITSPAIDRWYELARSSGASGGKLAGAGGGGFLLIYCEPEFQQRVTQVLEGEGLKRMTFRFERGGARVLMNATSRISMEPVVA